MPDDGEQFGCWWCWQPLPPEPVRRRGHDYCSDRCAQRELPTDDTTSAPIEGQGVLR